MPSRVFGSYPISGETSITIHWSPLGQPVGHGLENVVWLAFCSGAYLKQSERQIPMPIGRSSHAFGYSDKRVAFDDYYGLPKSVELYATNGDLACEYNVLETTNFLGRTFPLRFRVIQKGSPSDGSIRFTSQTEVLGRVKSIKQGRVPELSDEMRKKVQSSMTGIIIKSGGEPGEPPHSKTLRE